MKMTKYENVHTMASLREGSNATKQSSGLDCRECKTGLPRLQKAQARNDGGGLGLAMTRLLMLFSVSLMAHATPTEDLANRLNAVQTMRANFTQVVYDNRNKAVLTSYGRMSMQRPGKFRWEVTKPIPQLIVANASRLWIYDPDLEQVTVRSLKHAAGETPALLLSHVNMSLDNEYKVTQLPNKSAGGVSFSLVPKSQDSVFASIQLSFINNRVKEMRLQDHLGHVTK